MDYCRGCFKLKEGQLYIIVRQSNGYQEPGTYLCDQCSIELLEGGGDWTIKPLEEVENGK